VVRLRFSARSFIDTTSACPQRVLGHRQRAHMLTRAQTPQKFRLLFGGVYRSGDLVDAQIRMRAVRNETEAEARAISFHRDGYGATYPSQQPPKLFLYRLTQQTQGRISSPKLGREFVFGIISAAIGLTRSCASDAPLSRISFTSSPKSNFMVVLNIDPSPSLLNSLFIYTTLSWIRQAKMSHGAGNWNLHRLMLHL